MAICEGCHEDMQDVYTCSMTEWGRVETDDWLPRIRYGEEDNRPFIEDGVDHGWDRKALETLWTPQAECPDCLVTLGSLHHVGCDQERCPRCLQQAIGCPCEWTHVRGVETE